MRLKTRLLSFGVMAAVAGATPVYAAAQTPADQVRAVVTLDIPAGPASAGLNALATQADVQLFYPFSAVTGRSISAVKGEFTRDEAIRQMAQAAGLTVASDDGRTVRLEAPQSGSAAGAGAEVEALIVTAQKKEENIQDVPIAISAFSSKDLEEQKIEGGFDLLKAIPNVTFSKNNYSGYNFSIRGVGTKSISATSDPGVAVAFNNTSLLRNRLFEQEYLDVERVEVLRGPQGTLYGRNATSGVINVITAKPDLNHFEGRVKGEVGNYDARRMSAFVNVPLLEGALGLRVAGAFTQRDGYGLNDYNGERVDGRDLWTARATLALRPMERLQANLIWERFEEDDNRLRTGKQLCHRDPGPSTFPGVTGTLDPLMSGRLSQGCKPGSLYDAAAFGAPNGLSIPFVVAGQTLATYGYTEPYRFPDGLLNPDAERVPFLMRGVDPYGAEQSHDLRTIHSQHDAVYRAKADIISFDLSFDLNDDLTLTSQTVFNEDEFYSFQDYHRFKTVPSFNDSSRAYTQSSSCRFLDLTTCATFATLADFAPGGFFDDPQIGPANTLAGFEISSSESTQWSQEVRLQSDFSGPWNFNVGANYTHFKGLNDYYLFYNIVTMLAQGAYNESVVAGECGLPPVFSGSCVHVDPNPIESLAGDGHNYFRNRNPYKLESKAAFGELYWQATEDLKVTAGLRYTDDRKSFTAWRSQLLVKGGDYGPGESTNQRWTEVTGRLGVDWRPELSFTDETMVYAFYSRGYKGGGSNPPPAAPVEAFITQPLEVPRTFEPEFVDAFEVGTKNTLLGGALILNAGAFHYDYTDYQVSKVVDRTIVNENFDARVWGAELEAVWRPSPELRVNATLGYLDTQIGKGEKSIDIFNRTQGREGWSVVTPWLQQTSNCILPNDVLDNIITFGLLEGELAGFSPIVLSCIMWLGAPAGISGITIDPEAYPDANLGAGFYDDLSGNELPNAPHWTFNFGAQYTMQFDGGWKAIARGDYYRQAESYARVYNLEADRLKGWDNANVTLRIERPDDALAFELYAKNVFDETPITDAFLNSDSTGMTTNVFVLDPRLIGVSITKGF